MKQPRVILPPAQLLHRRAALGGIGLGLGAGLLAASGCSLGPGPVCTPPPVPKDARDAHARALLADIDTFVVLMLENRSFDHLFGGLALDRGYPGRGGIDGLTGDEFNHDSQGRVVPIAPMPGDGRGSFNPEHHWQEVAATFNLGRNDKFVVVNNDHPEVMSYLTRAQVPLFHALADRSTIFDQWHASFMGQTWPNRYYLHATTSAGRRINKPLDLDAPIGIWERMAERCASGRNYAAGPVLWYSVAFPSRLYTGDSAMVPGKIEDFFRDARAGNLPNFSLIDPDFAVNDAYPTHSLAPCEAFVGSIVRALGEGPQWRRSLLLILFDEHGGYFDHVVPPTVPDPRADFRQLGFRVPAIAIGPTVRQGAVVSTLLEHVSVAATLRARFGIETLSPRMDAANDISGCIDPALIGAPLPPPRDLPTIELHAQELAHLVAQASSQPELEALVSERRVPEALIDPRTHGERFASWLRHAQELEAVKVRG